MGKWTPERKAGYLSVDLGPELKADIAKRAEMVGQSISEWVREVLYDTVRYS